MRIRTCDAHTVKISCWLATLLLVAVGTARAVASEADMQYPAVANDVSFNAVMALQSVPATATIPYGTENSALQIGKLWLPSTASAQHKAPLIVFVHGGCWLNAYDMQHTSALSTALAQSGYAVWSLEYRRTGDRGGGWPGTFDDVLAGVAFKENLQDYPVDTTQFLLMGHSAGGHLALLAGTRFATARAVIGLAAITDLVGYARGENSCQTVTKDFMGTDPDSNPALYAAANPLQQTLHNNTYLLQGTADAIVPLSTIPVPGTRSLIVQGAGHFDWVHPGTRAFAQLAELLAGILAP